MLPTFRSFNNYILSDFHTNYKYGNTYFTVYKQIKKFQIIVCK